MPIDLKKVLGGTSGGGWIIGETRKLPIDPAKTIVEYNGMTLALRNAIRVILATDYPEFYALSDGFYSASFFITRNPSLSGLTNIYSIDSHGTTIIIVGNGGKIGRSTDGGVTWSLVSVGGVTANLRLVHYNPGLARWFIYYDTNKVLVSTDDAASFTDTTVTGLTFASLLSGQTTHLRAATIGNTTVVSCNAVTFVTTNGTSYTSPTMPSAEIAAGKLTKGNGYFCILTATLRLYTSTTGTGAWTNVVQFVKGTVSDPYTESYGVVFTGTRWILGVGGAYTEGIESSYPKTGPQPGPTDYYLNSITENMLAYTTGGSMVNPTGSWTYLTRTIGGYYITNWGFDGGSNYWKSGRYVSFMYNGPSDTFGSFGGYGDLYSQGSQWNLYARSLWDDIIANPTNQSSFFDVEDRVSGTTIASTLQLRLTNDSLIASGISGSANTFDLSTSGSSPSRSLPINTSGSGEGTTVTRIK